MPERDLEATLRTALAGRYDVERPLGAGGMAIVFLARDLRHDRPVALKVLRPELAAALGSERFLREIQIAARLHHPHILGLYDSGEADGLLFYVMPYVEGEALRDRLRRERQLPVREAVEIAREVADALAYAHSRGIVHRDIKPENILLESGHAVVADFGIARAVSEAGGDRLTETGLAVGTAAYMSPEQAAGEKGLDGRSDLYALGAVLYEMLAGEPPFTGPSVQAVLARRFTETPGRVSAARETIAPALDDAVARCLARLPADRFATAAELAAALEPATGVATPPPAVLAARPARPSPTRRVLIGGTAAIVGLALAGAWLASRGPGESDAADVRPSVAVLPFENLGPPDDEYFADGITEELTSRLAQISALAVTSRTSALQYKNAERSMREIGRELGVSYVLEGTVRTDRVPGAVGRVLVTPQLIRVADDSHLWAERYEASLAPGELFAVQARIAEQVVDALGLTLLRGEREAVHAPLTTDHAAHEAYLLGRFQWNRRTRASLQRAAANFEEAIARDSAFAAAWAGLADTYGLYPFYQITSPPADTAFARAKAAAHRAIGLDPDLAEPHASLGLALLYGDRDWDAAEGAYRRAIALDPAYPVARYWLAELLMIRGRPREAVDEATQAVALSPAAAIAHHILAYALLAVGDTTAALQEDHRALELEPDLEFVRFNLGLAALRRGDWDTAREELAQSRMAPSAAFEAVIRALRDPAARSAGLRSLNSARPPADAPASRDHWAFAHLYSMIGAADSAIALLRRALDAGAPLAVFSLGDPNLGPVRNDPRFAALRRELGLPE